MCFSYAALRPLSNDASCGDRILGFKHPITVCPEGARNIKRVFEEVVFGDQARAKLESDRIRNIRSLVGGQGMQPKPPERSRPVTWRNHFAGPNPVTSRLRCVWARNSLTSSRPRCRPSHGSPVTQSAEIGGSTPAESGTGVPLTMYSTSEARSGLRLRRLCELRRPG